MREDEIANTQIPSTQNENSDKSSMVYNLREEGTDLAGLILRLQKEGKFGKVTKVEFIPGE